MIRYGRLGWTQKMPFIASAHVVDNLFQTNNEKKKYFSEWHVERFHRSSTDELFRSCCGGFPWTFMTLHFHGTRKKWLKSYIFPRSISSYSVPIIIIHNNNDKVQMYMHIYWNRLLALFFSFCPEEWLRPLLRQDKQVLVHWWYYPDRWVFNC